jgi:hypothetical protein
MTDVIRAYHFVGDKLRDGHPIPLDGEWLTHDGECVMCESGLHASRHPFDALEYAPGPVLCLVECEDIAKEETDKLVCRRRRIMARFDASELLRTFARQCALDVIHLWDAPPVVRQYLETGDESLRAAARDAAGAAAGDAAGAAAGAAAGDAAMDAARAAAMDAAWAAAMDAAMDAAWAAARAAAWAAAGDAQRIRFASMVEAKFAELI